MSTRRVLPVYRLGTELVTDDQTSTSLHTTLSIVDQLVLPNVHIGRADIEAWLLLTLETRFSVHSNEGLRVLVEGESRQALVQNQFFR